MPYSQADLTALEEAIVSGAQTVAYESKSVTYRSLDDMFRLRDAMMRALGLAAGAKKTILVAHDRAY